MIGETAVIIGGGKVGVDLHLPRLSGICGANAIIIVEPDHQRLSVLRDKFRGRGDVTLSRELPDDRPFSVAVVATPAKFHPEYVERLRGRCTKLVIESPIARTLSEAESIVEQIESSDAIGFVCHPRRMLGSFRFVKQVLADGLFGDLQSVTVREGIVSAWGQASPSSFSRDLSGGGVLLDMGAHTLDVLLQVFDKLTHKRAWIDAEVHHGRRAIEANCVLELESGVPIDVVLSRNRHLSNTASFRFAGATLTLDLMDNSLDLTMTAGGRLHGVPGNGHAGKMELSDLYDAYYQQHVLPGDNRGVSPRDSLVVMRLIEDAYAGASLVAGGF